MAIIKPVFSLFGQTTAGKSMLLSAFLNLLLRDVDKLLDHPMLTPNFEVNKVREITEVEPPTPRKGSTTFRLKRTVKRIKTDASWSAHENVVQVIDNRGVLFGAGYDKSIRDIEQLKLLDRNLREAWKVITDEAHGIIVALDPTLVKGTIVYRGQVSEEKLQDDDPSENSRDYEEEEFDDEDMTDEARALVRQILSKVTLSTHEMGRVLSRLLDDEVKTDISLTYIRPETISRNYPEGKLEQVIVKRRIALCITKADLLADTKEDLDEISSSNLESYLETEFDYPTSKAVKALKKKFGEENIRLFLVSAAGYDPLTGKRAPIGRKQDAFIANEQFWRPYNVQAPFFWLMEQLEMDVISDYAKTGLLRWVNGNINNVYIRYNSRDSK